MARRGLLGLFLGKMGLTRMRIERNDEPSNVTGSGRSAKAKRKARMQKESRRRNRR